MPTGTADRIRRYEAWLGRHAADRAMVGLQWEPDIRPLPEFLHAVGHGRLISPEHVRPQLFLPYVEESFQRHTELCTDIIQPFAPGFGIPWVEAILGCPVVDMTP